MWHSRVDRNSGNKEFFSFLDSRFRGNDTLGLARQGRGELFHSDKMLPRPKQVLWLLLQLAPDSKDHPNDLFGRKVVVDVNF